MRVSKENFFNIRLLCAVTALLLAGCGTKQDKPASAENGTPERLSVYTSFYPMYDFATKVGGEAVTVVNLVPGGVEPHDWEPTPMDKVGLESADVFIYSGAGMEHWVDTVLPTLENQELVVVEASAAVDLEQGDDHHSHTLDPHVWLSPRNAKLQMEAIKDALVAADPDNGDTYTANFDQWAGELDTLDREYRAALDPLENRTIVVAHEAYGYLCREYDLIQKSAVGLSPDAEPSPAKMAELVNYAKDNHVKVIFFEEAGSSKLAETIAREVGAKVGVLSPLETMSQEAQAAGEDYFTVMLRNLEALMEALSA